MKREQISIYNSWRGIAAIMILFSHMAYLESAVNPFWRGCWNFFMHNGGVSCSFFFLTSGFFLYYTWKNQTFGDYLKSKLKRFYPLTFIVFLLALIIDVLLTNDVITEGVTRGSFQWFLNIVANIFLFKAFIPLRSTFYSFHGPSWYISVLFVFYIVAYWFMKGIKNSHKDTHAKWLRILKRSVIIAYILQLLICIVLSIRGSKSLYLCYINPYFRIFGEGLAGVLLCEQEEKIQEQMIFIQQKLGMSWTVLEIIAIFIFLFNFTIKDLFRWNVWQAWLQIIPMGMVLIVFRKGRGIVSKILTKPVWMFLGLISFELYMTHAFVYEGIPIIVGMVSKELQSWIIYHAGTRFIFTFFVCIVFAWLVNRLMNRLDRKILGMVK